MVATTVPEQNENSSFFYSLYKSIDQPTYNKTGFTYVVLLILAALAGCDSKSEEETSGALQNPYHNGFLLASLTTTELANTGPFSAFTTNHCCPVNSVSKMA